MKTNKVWQQWLLVALLFPVAGLLFYYATRSEEQRIVFSDASLEGTVTYKGKPVPYALVIVTEGKTSSTGAADAHGKYFVQYAPEGKVQLGVNTQAGRGMLMSATMAAAHSGDKSAKPAFVDVPAKFFNPATSGLTAEVKPGKQTTKHDIVIP